jgi:hypothetical protein
MDSIREIDLHEGRPSPNGLITEMLESKWKLVSAHTL